LGIPKKIKPMAIEKRHIEKYNELRQFFLQNGHCYVPAREPYADLYQWIGWIKQSRLSLSKELVENLESMGFDWMMYDAEGLRWQSRYYELKIFKEKYGHCRVPSSYKENKPLISWVSRQRKREKKMPVYRKKRLDEIGFSWSSDIIRMKEEKWMQRYKKLQAFKKEYGHCRVALEWKPNPSLGKWVARLRANENTMQADKKKLLDDIGFAWYEDMKKYKANRWWDYFNQLELYKEKNGHCRVTRSTASALSIWVTRQRSNRDILEKKKIDRLNDLGFVWGEDIKREAEEKWYQFYEELQEFKKEKGHCRVSERSKTHPQLGNWVARLRSYPERIEPEKMELLNKIGFAWAEDIANKHEQNWNNNYLKLKRFYEINGHCRVPRNYTDYFANWVATQYAYQDKLSPERRALLDKLNFHWEGAEVQRQKAIFNQNYKKLKAYFKEKGDLHVSSKDEKNKILHKWIANIRSNKKVLSKTQIKQLDQLGFRWSDDIKRENYEHWMKYYRRLVAHKRKFGHLNVSVNTGGEDLRNWINNQRNMFLTIEEYKKNLLNDINFEWSKHKIKEENWMKNYQILANFYEKYGHSKVPYNFEEDMPLRKWTEKLRYKRQELSAEQIRLLTALDFIWKEKKFPNAASKQEADNLKWEEKYKLLLKYYKKYGDCRVKASYHDKALFNWVCTQKRFFKKGILLENRQQRLNAINFVWYGNHKRLNKWGFTWQECYEQLVAFKKEHGHLDVPNNEKYKILSLWVQTQIRDFNKKKMNIKRRNLLEELGLKKLSNE
jgi:hypothetical protein